MWKSGCTYVVQMDKASILGDAIDYVKELQKRLRSLESEAAQDGSSRQCVVSNGNVMATTTTCAGEHFECAQLEQGRDQDRAGISECIAMKGFVPGQINVCVSMENDVALVKLHCPWRQTLLVDVLQVLSEFEFEVSAVRSSASDGSLSAILESKVQTSLPHWKKTLQIWSLSSI